MLAVTYGAQSCRVAISGILYRVDRILPQICTASAKVNMKHALTQMQYRIAIINVTLSFTYIPGSLKLQELFRLFSFHKNKVSIRPLDMSCNKICYRPQLKKTFTVHRPQEM